jgi:hypothetical protein
MRSPRLSESVMKSLPRSIWRSSRQLPRISVQLASFPLPTRVTANLAINQFLHNPEFGRHWISKNRVYFANDNRAVFFGKTIMGMFSICWIVRHFLEIPIIVDIAHQMYSSVSASALFIAERLPKMVPLVVT